MGARFHALAGPQELSVSSPLLARRRRLKWGRRAALRQVEQTLA